MPSSSQGLPARSAVALLGLALLAALGCRAAADPGSGSDGSPPPPAADLLVRTGNLVERVVLSGAIEARGGLSLLVPPNPEWQVAIRRLIDDGTDVAAGTVVAELDNASLVATLAEKLAAAAERRSELVKTEARLAAQGADKEYALAEARVRLAQAELDATVPPELRPAVEAARKDLDLERARTALEKAQRELAAFAVGARADLEALRAGLTTLEREVAAAEEALAQLEVRAPADGLFLVNEHPWEGRPLQEGDTVWVGMALGRLPDLTTLEVVASLEDVDDGRVVPGMSGTCRPDAFLERSFRCRVVAVTAMAQEPEPRSLRRAFRVRLAIEDAAPAVRAGLLPGMSVRCELARTLAQAAVLAPRAGLDLGASPPRARLPGGETAELTLGPCSAVECSVVAGLDAGQRLVAVDGGG